MGIIKPILDENGNIKIPEIVLCNRNKHKLGAIYPVADFQITPDLYQKNECSFKVYKEVNGIETPLWNKIQDLKIIYMPEYDEWFQISIDKDVSNKTVKSITANNLGIAELSQTILYNIEINTEDDIARDDYKMAYIYDPKDVSNSLLGRVLSKAPHYKIKHVDASLCKLVRSFSIDDQSIYDFLTSDLADELNCLVIVGSDRTVSLYDLEDSCNDCGHREDDIVGECPKCGSSNITRGYGAETPVYIAVSNLASSVSVNDNSDDLKNMFRVQGGDDVINAAIRAINPNGTEYINRFSSLQREDMSAELVKKIDDYQELYNSKLADYRTVMTNIYNAIDQILYLTSSMMPSPSTDETDANQELAKLTSDNLGLIAVQNLKVAGITTTNNAVKSVAQIFMSPGYEVSIESSTYENQAWSGKFKVQSVDDKDDVAINSSPITLLITDDYETFITQKIKKILDKESISDEEIYDWTKYSLNRLSSFSDAYQSCLDALIEMNISDPTNEFYNSIYVPYYEKKMAVDAEIAVREGQIKDQEEIKISNEKIRDEIQDELNFQKYLGEELYLEYCSYRREDTYQNDNYVSDGLSNTEILDKAEELLEIANKELYKASELQYDISCDTGNLFAIKEVEPFRKYFVPGNWIRISDNDNLYKLRLIDYTIGGSDMGKLPCNFSTVTKIKHGITDIKNILTNAKSMATSYESVKRQAKKSEKTTDTVKSWSEKGMETTAVEITNSENQEVTYDNHGLLCRNYDDISETYDDEQLKIVNNILAITDDNWKTVKAAIGKIHYEDPENPGNMLSAYGVLGETLVGKLLLGEALGIYNDAGSLKFTQDGLVISNGKSQFIVNPNTDKLFQILKGTEEILSVDKNGNGVFKGDIYAQGGTIGGWKITSTDIYDNNSDKSAGIGKNGASDAFWAGSSYKNRQNAPFRVNHNGELYASKANITGIINAEDGTIGGWQIKDSAIYKDVQVGDILYRVYFQPPLKSGEKSWILSSQKSTDNGKTFVGSFVLYSDGSASFGDGKTIINANGSASFANGLLQIPENGSIKTSNLDVSGNLSCNSSYVCQNNYGLTTKILPGSGLALHFTGGILTGIS